MDSSKGRNEPQKILDGQALSAIYKEEAKPVGWAQEAEIRDRGVAMTVLWIVPGPDSQAASRHS